MRTKKPIYMRYKQACGICGHRKSSYRVFSLTWPASMQIYWTNISMFFVFIFSHFNSLPPASLSLLLHFNCDFHGYLTRSRSTCIKCPSGINLLLVLKPRLFGQGYPTDIPLTVRNSQLTPLTLKRNQKKLYFLRLLNTVLRAVRGNSRDGECFNLDKQT